MSVLPRIGITLGDPRGIGPEIVGDALGRSELRELARWTVYGPEDLCRSLPRTVDRIDEGRWAGGGDAPERRAGELAARAVEAAADAAARGELAGLVTAPLSKRAIRAAGRRFPGHTELLRERAGVDDVTMMMVAESTPLGPPRDGPLRLALVTAHLSLRDALDALDPGPFAAGGGSGSPGWRWPA